MLYTFGTYFTKKNCKVFRRKSTDRNNYGVLRRKLMQNLQNRNTYRVLRRKLL